MSTLIEGIALSRGVTETEMLKQELDKNNWDIAKTAKNLKITVPTLRKAMCKNGIYNIAPPIRTIRRLFKGDYRKQDYLIIDDCIKLKKENPSINFKSFRQIISVLIMNERTKKLRVL